MSVSLSRPKHLCLWWLLFVCQLIPVVYIFSLALSNQLGAEPAKGLVEYLGEVSLILLIASLAVTPIKRVSWLPSLLRYRRMTGLYAFFYALVHIASYGVFLVDWQNFIEDLYSRPYVIMGALSFLVLLALALTSPKFMVRRLGRRWKKLHRLVYVAPVLAVVHVAWQVRSDYREALLFGVAVFVVLAFRYAYISEFIRNLFRKQAL